MQVHRRLPARPVARALAVLGALAVLVAGVVGPPRAAVADTRPTAPGEPATVSADPLPTVQIDGVVWQQVVIGTTVYAGGSFSTARPAGAPAGTSTVSRSNLLAYDIRTGALISSFAPRTNGQVMAITASPDGSRLYIGGDFTSVNGATVWRVAALNPSTGALIGSFLPRADSRVRAIVATADTVYLGGLFTSMNGSSRGRLAAVRASDAGLLGWRPTAEGASGVNALAISPDRTRVVVGGSFTSLNGSSSPGFGLGAVDAVTGALLPFGANTVIRNGGSNGAITNLSGDADYVYGTGYTVGRQGGTLEGTFSARWSDGALHWVEDCHGDSYATWPLGDVVYTVSHKHYCGNIGGFPQTQPMGYYHSTVVTKAVMGTATREQWGYTNYEGQPTPAMLNWYPTWQIGTYTGQSQGPWAVTATADYVVIGGEFLAVNGTPQQGLVRFARADLAPNRSGPMLSGSAFELSGSSPSSGVARLQWTANHDRDNRDLTYTLVRDGVTASPVWQTMVRSTFFQRPPIGFFDTGLAPGSTHTYRLTATDPWGNAVTSNTVTLTISGTAAAASTYASTVLADGPQWYWRLGEPGGNRGFDRADFNDLDVPSAVTRGAAGALLGDSDRASTFAGTSSSFATTRTDERPGNTLSLEAWIRTTTTRGGKIVGLGDSRTGTSILVDRHLYMDDAGRVYFGVRPPSGGAPVVSSGRALNDGTWHHVVGTLGSTGMAMYVDGSRTAFRSDVTKPAPIYGFWRIGGDRLLGWTGQPTSNFFAGSIDEVAVYDRALDAAAVARHWSAARTTTGNVPPVAAFTASPSLLTVQVDGSGSSDSDGTITGYAWSFGDGATATGVTASHTYAAAGTYSVTLTVTDDDGATGTFVRSVTVTSTGVLAADAFGRTVANAWGVADTGGTWTVAGTASRYAVSGGEGRMTLPTAGTGTAASLPISSSRSDLAVTVALDAVPVGGAVFVSVTGRRVASDEYRAKLRIGTDGAVLLYLVRFAGGAETTLASGAVPGVSFQSGDHLRVRLQTFGTGTTTLRAHVWEVGQSEPTTWQLTATDTTGNLQNAGGVGVVAYVAGSVTGLPVVVRTDDLQVTAVP